MDMTQNTDLQNVQNKRNDIINMLNSIENDDYLRRIYYFVKVKYDRTRRISVYAE